MGCDPFKLGTMGQGSAPSGSFSGAFYLIANLTPSATYDFYQTLIKLRALMKSITTLIHIMNRNFVLDK